MAPIVTSAAPHTTLAQDGFAAAGADTPDEREARLADLAAQCESAGAPGRELDCAVYEALGFVVRRKPTGLRSQRTPHGGIYLQGVTWKAVGRITVETNVAIDILARIFPDASWSLAHEPTQPVAYRAVVEGHLGAAPTPALALTAALLRATGQTGPALTRLTPREIQAAAKARASAPVR